MFSYTKIYDNVPPYIYKLTFILQQYKCRIVPIYITLLSLVVQLIRVHIYLKCFLNGRLPCLAIYNSINENMFFHIREAITFTKSNLYLQTVTCIAETVNRTLLFGLATHHIF